MTGDPTIVSSVEAARDLLVPRVAGRATEAACILHLGPGLAVLGNTFVEGGAVDSIALPTRQLIAEALRLDARAMVLAHNHPSGSIEPSAADLRLTRELALVTRSVGIKLIDHLIVGNRACLSFREHGLI